MIKRSLSLVFLASLVATSAQAQAFGGSLAVAGDQIFVGETGNRTMSGIIWVYDRSGGTWSEAAQLQVTDEVRAPDGFGSAIAADGGVLLAGAPMEDDGRGAAYLFRADGNGGWERVMRFTAGDVSDGAEFGSAVVLRDGTAYVSAPGDANGAGSVHQFAVDATGQAEGMGRLTAPTGDAVFGFGQALAFDGSVLLVSTEEEDGPAALYAFENGQATRVGEGRILERSGFGASIATQGGWAFVGAPRLGQSVGAVWVFQREAPGSWTYRTRLGPIDAGANARFGATVGFDNNSLMVGAPGTDGGNGRLYRYALDDGGDWMASSRSSALERGGFAGGAVVTEDLAVVGATGLDSGAGAVLVFDRDADGDWTEAATLINEQRGFPALAGAEIECEDNLADAFECQDVNITAFLPIKDLGGGRATRVNDIWGWTDPETGREIAIVGRTDGTAFVDVSDPYNPRYLGELPATEGSRHMIWRDIKVYADHAYVVADAALEHGVQVFDLRQLRDVGSEPVTFEETYLYDGIHSAHNIVINEDTGFAYAVGNSGGGETCGGGLHMIDLEDPARPVFAGCFAQEGTGRRRTGYVHDAQCVVYHGPDQEHAGKEICLGSNEQQFNIADVTDKDAPIGLSTVSYPNVAYAHQGWLTEDHRYFYMNDEGDEPQGLVEGTRTLVWDVTDLDDPILVNEYIAETTATDHNLYVVGDIMYQSNYDAGFRVLDISDPENPVEIGFFDTSPYEGGASWSNYPFFESGTIVVTGTGDGLFLLKNMARPRLVP